MVSTGHQKSFWTFIKNIHSVDLQKIKFHFSISSTTLQKKPKKNIYIKILARDFTISKSKTSHAFGLLCI
jgi:hypothetical protein